MNEIINNEKKILKFWDKNKIFTKSIKQRKGKKFFSFYDGPPFATGLPHYGHILATTIKDTVLRYWTMRGYQVPRRVGWDCHGLPVENLIEKELNFQSKKDIEEFGIDKFNNACRKSVFRCTNDFIKTLKRVGRWADYSNAYSTMDNEYIESVWWVFKQLWDQGLVYKDYRITPYCPRCGTPLSNFEVNQAYKDIEEESVFVKFALKDEKNTYLLVWTTTPWTLPANTGIAIGPKIKYVKVKGGKEYYILAEARLNVLEGDFKIEKELKAKDLIGKKYSPFYKMNLENPGYRVVSADFVSVEDGTGLVHIAPAFGEDDASIGKKEKLPSIITVEKDGSVTKGLNIPGEGEFVKKADGFIKKDLEKRGLLYKMEKIVHSYPFCWRCETPLLYYPVESWYVKVTKFKKQLIENNKKIRWSPSHLKNGRFGKWLEGARDWSISRNRFWGAPIPVWECDKCDEVKVIDKVKNIKDLHRPAIDKITFKCKCGGVMKRVPEVFDCWFESGSMPYGQRNYPFQNKKLVEKTFPADFIAEGLDQTRGWFYTLHVLATALTLKNIGLGKNKPAFKNVIVNGLVLGENGKKLSKRLKNYTAPEDIFEKYGADALRYFLLAGTPMGEDYIFSEQRIAETYRRTIMTLWNSFVFFEMYADKNILDKKVEAVSLLDKWILSRLNNLSKEISGYMNEYELTKAVRLFDGFIDDLSNWYIRRSRRRFQRPKDNKEKEEAVLVLRFCLMELVKLMAPFTPFISETIYQRLRQKEDMESVHLCDYSKAGKIDKKLEKDMAEVREIVNTALQQRSINGIKVRQPLNKLEVSNKNIVGNKELADLIKDEINVKKIVVGKEIKLDVKITSELEAEGIIRDLIRFIQKMRKDGGLKPGQLIYLRFSTQSSYLQKLIQNNLFEIRDEICASKIEQTTPRKETFLVEKEVEFNSHKIWLGIKRG
ncbi:isoleucine--tRNA ligase [Patescibacteria group bacterium]